MASDVLVKRMGTEKHNPLLKRPWRIVTLERPGRKAGTVERWTLATNDTEMAADLVALAYRYRWQAELFFRWLKCVLGCRHLLSTDLGGLTIQLYAALIASLLVSLCTGRRPTKRTFEMLCFFFAGWATAEEVQRHLETLAKKEENSS